MLGLFKRQEWNRHRNRRSQAPERATALATQGPYAPTSALQILQARYPDKTAASNARHLLDDLASSYTYALDEAVLVELIANSLDAKAANIGIRLDAKRSTFTVKDDGTGMTQDEFERYHDLAESTKVRGRGIGFAGLCAKLAHQVGRRVVTETWSVGYRGASEWGFKGSDL